jgi:hypothetical protein
MSVFADYGPEEQRVLLRAINAAAVLVSAASPSSGADTASEGFASAEYVLASLEANIGNTLVCSVIVALRDRAADDESAFPDYVKAAKAADAADQARSRLRDVAALLDTRAAPDEAAGYKDWLIGVARASAAASLEDRGFLGFGGTPVNDAERAAIDEVAHLLGRPAPLA